MAVPHRRDVTLAMAIQKDAFRQFQEELAALDKEQTRRSDTKEKPMERARREFLALRERYQLSVADVVAFFPEEEGIAYLQALIAASEAPARKRRVSRKAPEQD